MIPEEFKFKKPGEVRVRIAPSPTGLFHLGTARTALFNYLFAKQNQGSFILRIEDTDSERSKVEFEKNIIEGLKWLGLQYDEGPDVDGSFGPYRQSERTEIYSKYLKKLLDENKAYYCFCSTEELEDQRQEQMSRGAATRYNGKCANLSPETVGQSLKEGKTGVIRFRTPAKKVIFKDIIREKLEFDAALIGDFVIAKNLASPLYNFSAVVDDFEMKISHVIRGEDHLSNTPKQILVQEALGFPAPQYAHLPLILGQDRAKLSKRHGSDSISDFQKEGYLAETLINFMAFLGWNPGSEREIFTLPSLIKEFSLERIQKGGAVFNYKRLDFLNSFYIRQKSLEKLTELCLPYLIEANLLTEEKEENETKFKCRETQEIINLGHLQKIFALYQERLKKLAEIVNFSDFFFKEKLEYDKELLRWGQIPDKGIIFSLDKLEIILSKVDEENWNKENLENILLSEAETMHIEETQVGDRGKLLWPLRVALTGKEASAGPFEIAEILGREKVLKRIGEAKEKF